MTETETLLGDLLDECISVEICTVEDGTKQHTRRHLSKEEIAVLANAVNRWPSGHAQTPADTYRETVEKVAAAREKRMAELREALKLLFNTKWKSVDKDNMEFEGRVTCYQLDRARAALSDTSTLGNSK